MDYSKKKKHCLFCPKDGAFCVENESISVAFDLKSHALVQKSSTFSFLKQDLKLK